MTKRKKWIIFSCIFLFILFNFIAYFGVLCPDDYPRDFYFDRIQLKNRSAPFFAKDFDFIAKRDNNCQYDYITQSKWTFTFKGYMFSDVFNMLLNTKNKQCNNCILVQNDGPWHWGEIREYSSREKCGDEDNWSACL